MPFTSEQLLEIRDRGGRFLELGSATGVVTIMADLLGFHASGIEIAPELVTEARQLAESYGSDAHFATGSYLPSGYRFVSPDGDTRMGAVGIGERVGELPTGSHGSTFGGNPPGAGAFDAELPPCCAGVPGTGSAGAGAGVPGGAASSMSTSAITFT